MRRGWQSRCKLLLHKDLGQLRVGFYLVDLVVCFCLKRPGWFTHNHLYISICITQTSRITCPSRLSRCYIKHIYIYVLLSSEIPSSRTSCIRLSLLRLSETISCFSSSLQILHILSSRTVLPHPTQMPSVFNPQ